MIAVNNQPEPPPGEPPRPAPTVLADPHHTRADARMAARLISLGVVPDSVAEEFLKRAFKLSFLAADKTDDEGHPDPDIRGFAAVARIPIEVAKLERSLYPTQHDHRHTHDMSAAAELARQELQSELTHERNQRALEEDMQPGPIRQNGQHGPLENGSSSNGGGP